MGNKIVNFLELPRPAYPIKKLAVVKSVVIWGVILRMICRSQYSSLVAVDGVMLKELLNLYE